MFKVLIVDDEALIRKGLKTIIDWKSFECEVCGEASDGMDGMNKIKALLPDIIITDINMPGINGLTMIKEVKELIPNVKLIILTGYRDFEYIQEALKLGAFDYLLKPSKIEAITSIVKKAVADLKAKARKEEEINDLRKNFEKRIPSLRQKLLYDIIFTINIINEEVLEELNVCKLKFNDFYVIGIETDENVAETKNQHERQLYQFGIINTFEEIFSSNFNVINIPINTNRIIFIIQPKTEFNYIDIINENSASLQEMIKSCFNFTITIAISSIGTGIFSISSRAKEILKALDHKTHIGLNSIIHYEDFKNMHFLEDAKETLNSQKNIPEKNMNNILQKALTYISNNFQKDITLNDVAKYTYVSTYYLSRMFTKELGKNFVDYLNEIRIEKSKEYLKDPKFKSYEIAEMVGINDPHYFSKLFKKYAGTTPSEYKSSSTIHNEVNE